MNPRSSNSRTGFTLIELLVVIALILVLATLSLLIVPRLGDDQRAVRTADQVSMWLLVAKQRAYRDQAPRGLRLIRSDPTPGTPGYNEVRELVYIERPEDFDGKGRPITVPAAPYPPPGRPTGFIANVDLTGTTSGSNPIVEADDFLTFDSLETVPYNIHRIHSVSYSSVSPVGSTLTFGPVDPVDPTITPRTINNGNVVSNSEGYHIIRRERPLAGESLLQLPKDMIIDLTPEDNPQVDPGTQGFSQFPGNSLDIVFDQRGQLMGDNAAGGKVILRIRNGSKGRTEGDQLLVVVYARTGLIAVQPLDLTPSASGQPGYYANPFSFTMDGKASGL